MISPFSDKIRWSTVLPLLIILAPFIFFLIGIPFGQIVSDAYTYDAYARNIVAGHGYTLDGTTFSALREPGYPLFLALVFWVFGSGNYLAVYIVQTLLLGILGYMMYRMLDRSGNVAGGYIAGFLTVLLPSYGLYTHTTGTELLFTFLIGMILYLSVLLVTKHEFVTWKSFASFGLLCGLATLVRVQLVFFLLILVIWYLFWRRNDLRRAIGRSLIASLVFVAIVGSWVGFVHKHTGTFALTSGRIELALYTRAVRAQLSYGELTRYAALWVARSLKGGAEESGFLYDNEYHKIGNDYWAMATSTNAVARIKEQSIATILAHPGQYAYGNLIEIGKTLYIEHDYSDVLNRYIRASMYIIVYGLFMFGCLMIWKKRKRAINSQSKSIVLLATLFILYNLLILSPFDSIPRYNTPYLTLYIVIGCVGFARLYTSTVLEE